MKLKKIEGLKCPNCKIEMGDPKLVEWEVMGDAFPVCVATCKQCGKEYVYPDGDNEGRWLS